MKAAALAALAFVAAAAEDGSFAFGVEGGSRREAAENLAKTTGARIEVARGAAEKPVRLYVAKTRMPDALRYLAYAAEVPLARDAEGVWRLGDGELPEASRALLAKLKGLALPKAELERATLEDASALLQAMAGVDIVLDSGPIRARPVELRREELTGLDLLLALASLTETAWDLRWEGVFLASSRRLAEVPAEVALPLGDPADERDAALLEALERRLEGVELAERPLRAALEAFAARADVPVAVDPPALGLVEEASAQARSGGLKARSLLCRLLAPAGLAYKAKGGSLVVTLPRR